MVVELSYTSVSDVVVSWDEIKRNTKNYEEVAGVLLFQKLFKLDPSTQQVFSFGRDEELTDEFFESLRLKQHAKFFIQMIEKAIGLLGPDIDLLTEILMDLGHKHAAFGVQSSHYPPMGRALLQTIRELIGDKFTEDVKHSWLEVYQALSYDMARAHNKRRQSMSMMQ